MRSTLQTDLSTGLSPRPRRRWLKVVCLLVALMIAAAAVVAGVVGWQLTHPDKKPITNRPEALGLPYQNVQFMSSLDQVLLRGWLIPAGEKKDRIVIFAHGYRMNRSAEEAALPTAKALQEQGIASLLFDFRNSGESEGTSTSVGQFEKFDLLSAIDFANALGYKNIGLVGYSMGGAVSLMAAHESEDVLAVAADSPFADLRPYLEENLPVWSDLPAFPFTPLILWEIPLLTGMDPDQVRPIEAVKQLGEKPVLLIHAQADEKIPAQNSEQLKDASVSPSTELWLGPGTEHVGTYQAVPEEYLTRVTQFFVQHLKP